MKLWPAFPGRGQHFAVVSQKSNVLVCCYLRVFLTDTHAACVGYKKRLYSLHSSFHYASLQRTKLQMIANKAIKFVLHRKSKVRNWKNRAYMVQSGFSMDIAQKRDISNLLLWIVCRMTFEWQ